MGPARLEWRGKGEKKEFKIKGNPGMEEVSHFKMIISGDPKTEVAIDRIIRKVHTGVIRVDPEAIFEHTNFARISYRLIWTGITRVMGEVDNVHRTALRQDGRIFCRFRF